MRSSAKNLRLISRRTELTGSDTLRLVIDALSVAAEGGMAGIAKPMKGLGSGVFEVALPFRGNAFRVVHAFQKKSTQGIKTPKHEIDLIKDRLKRLKAMLR